MSVSLFSQLRNKYTSQPSNPTPSNLTAPASATSLAAFVNGGPESDRMAAEATACKKTVVNGVVVPTPPILLPVDVSTPVSASTTLSQQVDTVLIQTLFFDPTTRFSEFFPPPIPPPIQLVVKPYRFSNEPKARSVGCVGIKSVGKTSR
jgi:hypothetical protein